LISNLAVRRRAAVHLVGGLASSGGVSHSLRDSANVFASIGRTGEIHHFS